MVLHLTLICPFSSWNPAKELPGDRRWWEAAHRIRTSNSEQSHRRASEKMETFIIKMLHSSTVAMLNPLKKFQKNVNDKFHWHTQFLWHHQKITGVQSLLWYSTSPFNAICLPSSEFSVNSPILLWTQIFTNTFPSGCLQKSRWTISAKFFILGKPAVFSRE